MKLRRLPETDLARIAPLPAAMKRRALQSFNSGGGSWSYEPARSQNFNIANPSNPLGLISPRPSIDKIKEIVSRRCRCDEQEESCLEVVDLFDHWFRQKSSGAVERVVPSMAIGSLGLVRYWENFFFQLNGRNTFLFIDYRRTNGLTAHARKFVFSMMHQQIRLADPDFFDSNLLVLRFPQGKEERVISESCVNDDDLYSLAELSQLIDETYSIWREVLAERHIVEPKRAAGGMFG